MVTTLLTGDLPTDVTSLVGRRSETAEIRRLLTVSRLITLTGVGGVGKTRLAMHAARTVRRAFPGGVRLVELAELADPALVPVTVMQAMGLHSSVDDGIDALIEFLRPRQLLLILDGCEHLVAECAALVGELLPACAGLRVLATSREPLRANGEHTYLVPTLSVPGEQLSTGDRIASYDAVTLFTERAAAASRGFALTEGNREAVAALCRRLDGLPLAIELAAVRMNTVTPDELLTRLGDPHRLLTAGSRTTVARHRTLRAAMAWSYQRCSAWEKALWARLSVFAGGFDLSAAESVCSDERLPREAVFETLSGLVEKSILVTDTCGGKTRYRALQVIREFGRELLAGRGEHAMIRRRHHDYYFALAQRLEREWFGSDQERLFASIRAERANLRVTLDSLLTDARDQARAQTMAAALWSYWIACGQQREGQHWLNRALADDAGPSTARAAALWVQGYVSLSQGDPGAANRMAAQSQGLATTLGDLPTLAHATHTRGVAEHNLDGATGTVLLREGVDLEAHNPSFNPFLVLAKVELGWAYCMDRCFDEALAVLAECRDICERHDERWLRSWALTFAGLTHWMRGEFSEGDRSLREAAEHQTALGDVLGLAVTTEVLAWTAMSEGDAERAARLLGASRELWQPVGAYLGSFELRQGSQVCTREAVASLGTRAFEKALEQGRRLTGEQVTVLIAGGRPVTTVHDPARPDLTALTAREAEVAGLLAKGLTNKEIARDLVVSLRTVDSHVQHILTKLGFNSRNQVTALFSSTER
ncbi:LuxR C-terminal-related transcriptional regulator [Saccharopolyspora shandongensis]|uniref:LuxR C-terminal-related transcriptional regulator n=1 Tax=Saccharopolyspora shandongensis TaxID=418495 RepID=UPI0033EDAD63